MKLSEAVAKRISQEVGVVFGVTGGAIVNLFDSLSKELKIIPLNHEQSCAMAADTYSRLKGFGVCVGTSGPGATNLITGVACSWFDSIPLLVIAGQVPRNQLKTTKVRQKGFQEVDSISLFRPITKYSGRLTCMKDLEKAIKLAKTGRKGPVFLEFCDDDQRKKI